jgi:hypothetical protein
VTVSDPEVRDVDAGAQEQSRYPVVAGAAAGLWALLVGVGLVTCLVMLAWAVSPNSAGDGAAAWRAAGSVWLGAHQVPMLVGGRELTLLPLGALVLGLLLTRRSGRWAGQLLDDPTPAETVGIITACVAVYGTGGAGVAWLSAGDGTRASPVTALMWTGAVALVGVTWGVAAQAGLGTRLRALLSDAAWRTAVGATAAVVGLFAAGGVLVTVSLVRHFGQVTATLADLEAGPVGALALTLLGILALPTLDIWAMGVLVGPGFTLGPAEGLSAFGGQVESLPALPVLAAIPTSVPAWAPALLLVPVSLGWLSGRIRWGRDLPTLSGALVSAVGVAAVVMAQVTGLAFLASGSLGGGRLAQVGPAPLVMGACAAGLVLLGFLAEAGFQGLRLSWELHRAEQRSQQRSEQARAAVPADDPVGATSDHGGDSASDDEPDGAGSEAAPAPSVQPAPRRRRAPARQESIAIPVMIGRPSVVDSTPGAAPQDQAEQIDADSTHDDTETDTATDVGTLESDLGDCTVDLTVDEQDLIRIRAAARSTRGGNEQDPPRSGSG